MFNILSYALAFFPGIYIYTAFKHMHKKERAVFASASVFFPLLVAVFSLEASVLCSSLEFFGVYVIDAIRRKAIPIPQINIPLPVFKKPTPQQEKPLVIKTKTFPSRDKARARIVRGIAERLYVKQGKFHAAGIWRQLYDIYGDQVLKDRIYIEKWISSWMKSQPDIVFKEQVGRTKYYSFSPNSNA